MHIRELFTDDDAVSPVIGVILMVAITVILAAVIASFVLGLGDQTQETTPQASFTFDFDSGNSELTITHDGGDTIDGAELYIRGDKDGSTSVETTWESQTGDTEVKAGKSLTLSSVSSTYDIRVVYESTEGDNSATLGREEGPDA